jgi:hypothetical protein
MRLNGLIALLAATAFLQIALQAFAGITVYSSREEWIAATGAHETENFESFTDLTQIPLQGGVFSSQHFDIAADQNHGRIGLARDGFFIFPTPGVSGTFFVGDVHDPALEPPHFNTIRFDRPLTAFGANIAALDDGGLRAILIGGEAFDVRGFGNFQAQFFGVTSTTPFLTVDIRNKDGIEERYALDNVSYKFVPEPSSPMLILIGLCALLVTSERSS